MGTVVPGRGYLVVAADPKIAPPVILDGANDFTLTGSHYIVEIPSSTCDGLGSACDWPEPPDPPKKKDPQD